MSGTEAIDAAALRSLVEMVGGDAEFVGELVDTYLEDARVQLAEMHAALAASSAEQLLRPAHTLKGNSANLGALALAELCRELEAQARAGSLEGAAARVAAAEAEFERVTAGLEHARARDWNLE